MLTVAFPEEEWEGQSVAISRGDTVSEMVIKVYGDYNLLAIDLIKEFNPHIVNLDRVAVGARLWLPPHTRETLVRKQSDSSYHLILGSFQTVLGAREFSQLVNSKGYTTVTVPRRMSSNLVLHRVEIVGLTSPEAVNKAWELVRSADIAG